jgi:hypothetical protein
MLMMLSPIQFGAQTRMRSPSGPGSAGGSLETDPGDPVIKRLRAAEHFNFDPEKVDRQITSLDQGKTD